MHLEHYTISESIIAGDWKLVNKVEMMQSENSETTEYFFEGVIDKQKERYHILHIIV